MSNTLKQEDSLDYKGKYNRLFPAKISTTSFLTIYILFLFEHRESFYGKELIDEIAKRFEGRWKPSHGIVYPMLRKLEEEGLLIGYWEDEDTNDKKTKRIYKITTLGKRVFREELKKHYEVFVDSYNMMVQILGDLYNKDIDNKYIAIEEEDDHGRSNS